MKILKSVKQEVKISFLYVKDLAIVGICGFIVYIMQQKLMLPMAYFIALEVIACGFGFFLTLRPRGAGGVRNITVMMRLFKMDNEVYHHQKIHSNTKTGGQR